MFTRFQGTSQLLLALLIGQCSPEICAQVAKFDLVSEFGGKGENVGQFFWPTKVAVDQTGTIIVSDSSNDRIQICSQQGECRAFGEFGSQLGQFESPAGIDIDDRGNLVIADSANNRIQVCDYQGNCETYKDSSGNEPQISWPVDLAFDSRKRLHIINSSSYLICPADGDCFAAVDQSGNEISFQFAQGLTIDQADRALIADRGTERILICEHSAFCEVLLGFDAPVWLPNPPGSFSQPNDVSIDADGRIYVSGLLQICDLTENQCYVAESIGGNSVTIGPDQLIYMTNTNTHKILVARLLELSNKFPINPGLNGPWYNPATPGQGIFVNVFPDSKEMFVGWFTFDLETATEPGSAILGDTRHRWLTAQGNYQENTASLQTYLTEGGNFLSSVPVPETNAMGEMIITFRSCSEAKMDFNLSSGGEEITGSIPLVRISNENLTRCEQLASETYP